MKKIITADTIITMTEQSVQALLIENGWITAVGNIEELKASHAEEIEVLNFKGKTILPGFIDSHSHISQYAMTIKLVALEGVASMEELIEKMQEALKKMENPDEWCIGFGYDHNSLKEKQHPDKTILDCISKHRPVMIAHASGHMGVVNSAGLKALNITKDTPNPAGGKIGRFKDKEPSGYLEELAFTQLSAMMPKPDLKKLVSQWQEAQKIYLSYGITTAQEGYTKKEQLDLLQSLSSSNQLKLDVVCYLDMKDDQDAAFTQDYVNHLRIGGYKIFLDGSPQGKTAWMLSPYLGEKEYCGYPIYQDEEVAALVKKATQNKIQLLAHCNGDAAAKQFIDAVLAAKKEGQVKDSRPVMIHAQLLSPEQLPELKKAEIIPSFFIAHVYHWGDVHIENFGKERAAMISCAHSALKEDILFTFHQDTPVIAPNMMETVWCAVNRLTKSGICLGKNEKISVMDALKAITINGAFQYHEENRKGSLETGKLADFVVLDENPLTLDPMKLRDVQVYATFKEGECVWTHHNQ